MIPSLIIVTWLLGLFSFAMIGGAIYLLYDWYQQVWVYDPNLNRFVFEPNFGFNALTAILLAALLLLIWTFFGGMLLRLVLGGKRGAESELDPPRMTREGTVQRLPRPDGSELQVEMYGPSQWPAHCPDPRLGHE